MIVKPTRPHLEVEPQPAQPENHRLQRRRVRADHGAFIADRVEIEPGFFEAAGIEIVRGRNFNDADRPDTRPVVIVSEAMARRFWADGDAVGRLVRRHDRDPPWPVVGVASDAKVRQLGESPRDMVYLPRVSPVVALRTD